MEIKLEAFNRREVLEYLLWRGGEIEPEIDALVDDCMAETLRVSRPRYTYRVLPVDRTAQTPSLAFAGEDVQTLLTDCKQIILFAATLGAELEMAIRRAQARDLTRALVLDCCGSAAIEAVCDAAERQIMAQLSAETVWLTDRFSPGYGDLPLAVQRSLCGALDVTRRLGVSLTDTCLMNPQKTVTAIIGLADRPQMARIRGCAYCMMNKTCALRKGGKRCGD